MKAIVYTAYGGPEVTQFMDVAAPEPAEGEVQVRVAGVGLNPIDWHQRQGELKLVHPQSLPAIGGNEFSGTISALGDSVSAFAIGDAVVCRCTKTKWSAMGEFVTMPVDVIAKAPSIPLVHAAGLPLAGLTAYQALEELQVKAGDRLLITGGAGSVGQFAIQLAKLRGADVTTTASSAGFETVKRAGADEIIDYRNEKVSSSCPFDKVFDTVGGELEDAIAASKGTVISVGGPQTPGCLDSVLSWWMAPLVNIVLRYRASTVLSAASRQGITYRYMFMTPDGQQLAYLCKLVDEGKLRIPIDSEYPADQFQAAFEKLESGHAKGKILLDFSKVGE